MRGADCESAAEWNSAFASVQPPRSFQAVTANRMFTRDWQKEVRLSCRAFRHKEILNHPLFP
jgi:hypothetical protein